MRARIDKRIKERGAPPDLDKIRAEIAKQGRTTKWLADRCGVGVGHFRQAMNGQRSLSQSALMLLLQALDMPIEDEGRRGSRAS